MNRSALLLWLILCGCGAGSRDGDGRVSARVRYATRDSVRFEASASLRRCGDAGGFVLEGGLRGNGMLVWLRGGDSPPRGRYRVLSRGDTLTPRGAVVAVRFMTGDLAHGLVLDSGEVMVTAGRSGAAGVSATVRGAGLESAEGRRVGVEAEFAKTGLAADGARCQTQL